MNKRKAIINITTSVIFKVTILIVSLFSRRYLLNVLGTEATGLYSLYISIIGFLAIAELGVGTAITFSLYKPITDNKNDQVSALYYLYKKVYSIILLIILVIGLVLTPFIPYIAKENTGSYNIYITYLIFLGSTLVTYLYAYKTSFIDAHLDKYITTTILSIGKVIEALLQIIILIYTKSFILFLSAIFISNLFQLISTNIIFHLKYKKLINNNRIIPKEVKDDVVQKTKAMFLHKIGGLLVMSTDSIVISAFVGISLLGRYSNYTMIVTGMISILALIFSSIIAVIGHSYAKNTKDIFHRQFKFIYLINYVLALVFFLGFYATIDNIVTIIFGEDLIMGSSIVLIISINYFVNYIRQAVLSFRDASGLFYHDRYKPLLEGVINLILSLILVNVWGIVGVLIATITTNLFITHIVEPFVLYKYGFERSPKKYYIYNYLGIVIFLLAVYLFDLLPVKKYNNPYKGFIINGLISVAISFSILLILYIFNKTIREVVNGLIQQFLGLFRNHNKDEKK